MASSLLDSTIANAGNGGVEHTQPVQRTAREPGRNIVGQRVARGLPGYIGDAGACTSNAVAGQSVSATASAPVGGNATAQTLSYFGGSGFGLPGISAMSIGYGGQGEALTYQTTAHFTFNYAAGNFCSVLRAKARSAQGSRHPGSVCG
jgi:hypothetical protein